MVVTVRQPESVRAVRYTVPRWSPAWAIPEVPVPESQLHDQAIEYVRAVLLAWVARASRRAQVLRNIGIRWFRPEPRYGFEPDLCLLDRAPDASEGFSSLRLWEPGLEPPALAIEIVSPGHPYKNYIDTPDRAAACGIGELWVYDPLLAGPKGHGGPFALQVWRREGESFARVHAGDGPVFSEVVGAWLHPRATRVPAEAQLRVSDQPGGEPFWPTLLEQTELRASAAERELAELRAKLPR